jgi:hypothetical protein
MTAQKNIDSYEIPDYLIQRAKDCPKWDPLCDEELRTFLENRPQEEEFFNLPDNFYLYVILGVLSILLLFISYKVIRLIIKGYKKLDRWLDK